MQSQFYVIVRGDNVAQVAIFFASANKEVKMNTWLEWCDKVVQYINNSPSLQILLKTAAALGTAYIAYFIIKRVTSSIEKKTDQYEWIKLDSTIFNTLRRLLLYILFVMTGTYLIRLYGVRVIEGVFYALMVLFISGPFKELVLFALHYLEQNIVNKTDTKIDDIIFDLLNRFTGTIIIVIAIIMSLDLIGVNVMPFIAGAGVAGVAIGFAAKDTLSNLIAGVLLIMDRPFEINDRIEVWSAPSGSATWGDVIDIGIRATKIKTTDNIIIIIPNNEIMKRDIVNYTLLSSQIRVRINIGVAYEADIENAKKVIMGIADTADWILKTPAPKVVVRNFGESSVDLQLRVWISDARNRMNTISYITDNVKSAFDKEGIEIPYPKREISVTLKSDNKNES